MSGLHSSPNNEVASLLAERAPRNSTNWIAVIRTSEGIDIPCNVKDVSKTGAKLGVPSSYHLPEKFMVKVLGKDFVLRVALVWRKGNFAGVKIAQVAKLAPVADTINSPVETNENSHKAIGGRRSRFSNF